MLAAKLIVVVVSLCILASNAFVNNKVARLSSKVRLLIREYSNLSYLHIFHTFYNLQLLIRGGSVDADNWIAKDTPFQRPKIGNSVVDLIGGTPMVIDRLLFMYLM